MREVPAQDCKNLKSGTMLLFENHDGSKEHGALVYVYTYTRLTKDNKGNITSATLKPLRCMYVPRDRTHAKDGLRLYAVGLEVGCFKMFYLSAEGSPPSSRAAQEARGLAEN